MILNPRWLDWLSDEEDENGNRTKLKENTPDDILKEYEKLIKEEQESMRNNKLKKTIF
jgi:hypothetical protein